MMKSEVMASSRPALLRFLKSFLQPRNSYLIGALSAADRLRLNSGPRPPSFRSPPSADLERWTWLRLLRQSSRLPGLQPATQQASACPTASPKSTGKSSGPARPCCSMLNSGLKCALPRAYGRAIFLKLTVNSLLHRQSIAFKLRCRWHGMGSCQRVLPCEAILACEDPGMREWLRRGAPSGSSGAGFERFPLLPSPDWFTALFMLTCFCCHHSTRCAMA